MNAVGDAQPALAAVALRDRRGVTGRQPHAGEAGQVFFPGLYRRPARMRELVLAHDLEGAGRGADQRKGVGERREVVRGHTLGQSQQVARHRRDVQQVAQRKHAAAVLRHVGDAEHDPDDGLRAERHGDERPDTHVSLELGRHLVVERLREGPRADEWEDRGVAER